MREGMSGQRHSGRPGHGYGMSVHHALRYVAGTRIFQKIRGVSRAFALYTATKRNAEIAGIGDETGSVEVGKSADFLITEKNPLEDFSALRTPRLVSVRGRIFKNPKVKKNKTCERELDKYM